ncbi:glycosyltransferase family 4 protein [Listeria ivanovii]|uniref:Putative human N-acetylglucosaminyl-phosphatidylinositol biosynthetic protein n=1 Tax=Listeria ivanovii (strain ATCC BAA-678 / PAM 55) TaxID=881621 RepID=G2ZFR8_LISIP|nr:glycosyltransferase family 4 protein [Listeria ivanovii]AHI56983.1 glycosyl transferase family 1 [Listeria ivanovii WSLC3009]AIS66399.1 1,2-diacylglycerol 3-glucosyltransferase [Listeria ivanovii subsp. ivanovii]MBC1759800.1 glycosyltransferase family 4 protein [Listeria ivanovii]MBK3915046.1 glycosyltransferase family 4 protein [Listeria ivanovii subsp. ivanovii]MBK3922330.1 glycosyltransferase family 4 protein [Listeria ivanovii subsp. ivanovii]
MNIGIFTDTYSPQISGVATSIMIMENELRKQGHTVYIFTTTDPNADREREEGRVFRLPSVPFVFFPERRVAVAGMNKFIKLVGRLDLDIIHTHTEFSLGLLGKRIAKKYNIPSIHTYHTMYVDYLHYIAKGKILTPSMVGKMIKTFCDSYDAIIAPTAKVRHHLEAQGIHKLMYTIPTGTDISSFAPVEKQQILDLKKSLGIGMDDSVILSLGRIAHEKNIDAIINAMPEILQKEPNAKLVIVGDGPVRKDLEKIVETKNLEEHIIFTGAVDWENIGLYYQLGDLFVSASTTETQGLTYAEAMAASLPVVAKRDESIEGFLTDRETAFLFDQDDELADLLVQILTDKNMATLVANNGRVKVESISADQFGRNIEAMYEEICEIYRVKRENGSIKKERTLIRSIIASEVFSLSSSTHSHRKERSSHHD